LSAAAGLPARKAALDVLSQVLRKRRPLDAAPETLPELPPRDAGFARALVGETLRRFGQLDALIRTFVPKTPPPHKAGPALEILLMGACELLFLDVAAHAAVDAANRLAQGDDKARHFKPLINAVLRRVSREGVAAIAAQDLRVNVPDWLWGKWCNAYGEDVARAIAAAHLTPAPLDIVLKDAARNPFADTEPFVFDDVLRLREQGRVEALPEFSDGAWWVQDIAATLPARLLGDVRGQRVIDLCAAPGGKTAQLIARGAAVTAVEREADRAARLRENLARLQMTVDVVVGDARDWKPAAPAPFVLLDAPCSATGTIRRHPDLPWIKGAADVNLCAGEAEELLHAAADMVAPGGTLVFAVCSLEPEEGAEQAALFLERRNDFVRVPVTADEIAGHAEWIADGDLRTLPCHLSREGGMDGFYAARLKRFR
jgi:16S rRNA (cytosine967-C5)-methyltransferase